MQKFLLSETYQKNISAENNLPAKISPIEITRLRYLLRKIFCAHQNYCSLNFIVRNTCLKVLT